MDNVEEQMAKLLMEIRGDYEEALGAMVAAKQIRLQRSYPDRLQDDIRERNIVRRIEQIEGTLAKFAKSYA